MSSNEEHLQQIENKAGLISNYSGWDVCEHPEKEHMAFDLADKDVPWLLQQYRDLQHENEQQLERIRELGYKREAAVKALGWALDKIGHEALVSEGNKGEWACRVLAVLKGQRQNDSQGGI